MNPRYGRVLVGLVVIAILAAAPVFGRGQRIAIAKRVGDLVQRDDKGQLREPPSGRLVPVARLEGDGGIEVIVQAYDGAWSEKYKILAVPLEHKKEPEGFKLAYDDPDATRFVNRVHGYRSLGDPFINLDIYAVDRANKRMSISDVNAIVRITFRTTEDLFFWDPRLKVWFPAKVMLGWDALDGVHFWSDPQANVFVVREWPIDDMEVDSG